MHNPRRFDAALILVIALGLVLGACVRQNEVIFEDQGALCAMPDGYSGPYDATMLFESGDRITIRVAYEGCLSSSCDVNRHMSCEVVTDGTTLVVHSQGGFTEREGSVSCTEDCGFLEAECSSSPLSAGEYIIVHGDDQLPLTVPSSVQGLCDAPYQ